MYFGFVLPPTGSSTLSFATAATAAILVARSPGRAAAEAAADDASLLDYVNNNLPKITGFRLESCGDPTLNAEELPGTAVASARSIVDPKAKFGAVLEVCGLSDYLGLSGPLDPNNDPNLGWELGLELASQDFSMGLETYLERAIPYFLDEQYEMCEACADACNPTMVHPNDDDNTDGGDAKADCDLCTYECAMIENMVDNGYIDATEFLYCQMIYDPEDDGRGALYAGPMCASSGSRIEIGVFTDEECIVPDYDKDVDDYLMDGDGNSMGLSYHLLIKAWPMSATETCLSCEQLGMCDALFEAANEFLIGKNPDVDFVDTTAESSGSNSNNNNNDAETLTPMVGFLDYVLNDLPKTTGFRLENCGDPTMDVMEPPATAVASARSIIDPKAKSSAVLKVCSLSAPLDPNGGNHIGVAQSQFEEELASRGFAMGLETYLDRAIPYFLDEQYTMCCSDACSGDGTTMVHPNDNDDNMDGGDDDVAGGAPTVIGDRTFFWPLVYHQYQDDNADNSNASNSNSNSNSNPSDKNNCGGIPASTGMITSFEAMGDGTSFCSHHKERWVTTFTKVEITSCERTDGAVVASLGALACVDPACSVCDDAGIPHRMTLPGSGFAAGPLPDTCWRIDDTDGTSNTLFNRFANVHSKDAELIDAYWKLCFENSCLKDTLTEEEAAALLVVENNSVNDYSHAGVDCDTCDNECAKFENMEDNGYMDASIFLSCTMIYDPESDDEPQLFAGPMCASNGSKIKIGLFRDNECTVPEDTKGEVEDYIMDENGSSMRLSYHLLRKAWPSSEEACLPCEQLNMCDALFEAGNDFLIGKNPEVDFVDTTATASSGGGSSSNNIEETAAQGDDESEAGALLSSSSGGMVLPPATAASLLALVFLAGALAS